jgi:hypothetical protein
MTALATQMRHFGLMSAIAQKVSDDKDSAVPSDYRALVCIFMAGGNDGNNTLIPNHNDGTISNYTAYSNARLASGLAIDQVNLLPISVPRMNNLSYGLHPALGQQTINGTTIVNNGVHELWATRKDGDGDKRRYARRSDDQNAIPEQYGTETVPVVLALRSGFAVPGRTKRSRIFYRLGRQDLGSANRTR